MDAHSLCYHHIGSPGLGKLAKILGDASVQTMLLCYGWDCRTFQTASHINVIHIWDVWASSTVGNGHRDAHSLRYHHRHSPGLGEFLAEILGDVSVQTIPLRYSWGCRTFQTASHIHVIQIWGVWSPSTVGDGHMAAHSLRYNHRHFPRFGRVSQKSRWCKCANHATSQRLRLKNLSNCITHPWHTYIRCLRTFNCWWWEYGCTFTPLPPQTFPRFVKVSQKSSPYAHPLHMKWFIHLTCAPHWCASSFGWVWSLNHCIW